jgi:inhibitor of KinA
MMGFTPGFPYMGKLDDAIVTPRLEVPRTNVPAGSVAIAGLQTGIYPLTSPGGWRLIGHTSLILFDPNADIPFLFTPGDEVKFIPEN